MGKIILITITTHHTRTVTSYNEAPWDLKINMGPYCRTLVVIPKFNWSTEMKASFVAEQDDCGIHMFQHHTALASTVLQIRFSFMIRSSSLTCLVRMQLRQFRCISFPLSRHAPLLCKSRTTFVNISSDYQQFRPSYSSVRTYLLFSCCWKWNALL